MAYEVVTGIFKILSNSTLIILDLLVIYDSNAKLYFSDDLTKVVLGVRNSSYTAIISSIDF